MRPAVQKIAAAVAAASLSGAALPKAPAEFSISGDEVASSLASPLHRVDPFELSFDELIQTGESLSSQGSGPYSISPAVSDAQTILSECAGAALTPDGKFGPKTEAAIAKFQRDYGLSTSTPGVLDAATAQRLKEFQFEARIREAHLSELLDWSSSGNPFPLIVEQSRGPYEFFQAVYEAQQLLQEAGFDIGSTGADGRFGTNTGSALSAFQESRGLPPSPSVTLDRNSIEALLYRLPDLETQRSLHRSLGSLYTQELQRAIFGSIARESPAHRDQILQHLASLDRREFPGEMLRDYVKVCITTQFERASELQELVASKGQSDAEGRTILENLAALSVCPLAPPLDGFRSSILVSCIDEALSPAELNQGTKGTCSVTSVLWHFYSVDPSEALRLVRGLCSPEGQVRTRSGDLLSRAPDSLMNIYAADGRTLPERILQSALMDFGDGSDAIYSNERDQHIGEGLVHEKGLTLEELGKVCSAIYGSVFKVKTFTDPDQARAFLQTGCPEGSIISLKWPRNIPLQPPASASQTEEAGHHAVSFLGLRKNGDMVIRNPWGKSSSPSGTEFSNPTRRVLDPATGTEVLPLESWREAFAAVLYRND